MTPQNLACEIAEGFMTRDQQILDRLSEIVRLEALGPGDRLPAERKLAPMLGISRNTLRGILRLLEARGLVKIRRGSGCYLRTRLHCGPDATMELRVDPEKVVADLFEAAFMFLPLAVEQAAMSISERQLSELQQCNIALSRRIMEASSDGVWNESLAFFRLVAVGTGNEFIVRMVELLCSSDMASSAYYFVLGRDERELLFADHVKILNALRGRDAESARYLTEDYLLGLAAMLEKRGEPVMSDLMFRTVRERENV